MYVRMMAPPFSMVEVFTKGVGVLVAVADLRDSAVATKPLVRNWDTDFWQARSVPAARGRSLGCNIVTGEVKTAIDRGFDLVGELPAVDAELNSTRRPSLGAQLPWNTVKKIR